MSEILVIRADANTQMGTGHIMRCIALGQGWQDAGGDVVFVTSCENSVLLSRLEDEGFVVEKIGSMSPDHDDLERTLRVVARCSRDGNYFSGWMVIDGYHFDLDYQQGLRSEGIKLLLIDDYNHLQRYEADLLLNQNTGSDALAYTGLNSGATKLLGPHYALLRREFRTLNPLLNNTPESAGKILVTLGGGDPDNVTGRVLQALSALNNPELHVKIVIGAANPNREMVEQMADKSSFLVELLTAVSDMTSLYEWADLAISAGGSTCWELCYMGVPFLVVVIAENQLRIAAGLDQAGAALNLGWHDRLETEEVANILGHVIASGEQRAGLRAKGRQLVDGLGAEHVAEILIHAGRG